ncbi:MAG: hypothetical protein HF978_20625 [Desulfobacteraceae bacterium]|nr:hypothetical protein [Desulfobacteraceae bacterium]MBC2757954.1 hypothetical protein [Desulfobacteraceae bacterium]
MNQQLRIINGGLQKSLTFRGIKLIATPRKFPPANVDALVFEEDAFLIMSDEPEHIPPAKHPIRLMNEIANFKPEVPGNVVIKGRNPIRMLAVVHDVNRDPTWKEEWIEKAICAVFQKAEILKIKTLGLPMLGTKHGKLNYQRFSRLLARSLRSCEFEYLKIIWLIAPVPVNTAVISVLTKELNC